jgi:hypothetical protein
MKTDAQLQQAVIAQLNWESAIQATHIGVEVRDGVVTLAGDVASYSEKWHAERAVQRVRGVKALAIELKVKLEGAARRTDADIGQSAIKHKPMASIVKADIEQQQVAQRCPWADWSTRPRDRAVPACAT